MPFGVTGTLFDTHSIQIEEIINKNVDTILPTLDPAWRDTVVSSQGVGPASSLGRDLRLIKVYRGGLTGVIEQARPYNDFVLYGDSTADVGSKMYTQSANQTWPDAMQGPVNKPYRLGVGMRAMLTNLAVTMGEMTAEATPAFIGDVIAPKMKGFAQNLAHTLCNYWYVSQNSGYALGKASFIFPAITNTSGAVASVTFIPDNYAIDRFYVGQRLDVIKDNSGSPSTATTGRRNDEQHAGTPTVASRLQCFVSAVDELTGKVTISIVSKGTAVSVDGSATTYWLCYANSKVNGSGSFTGIAGINSWMKFGDGSGSTLSNDNALLGGERDSDALSINVNVHPEFKSFQMSSVGVLTEHKLRQYIRRFHAAKNKYGQTIDCLIAADGIWLSYEAQKIGQYNLDRTSRLSSVTNEGSEDGFKFTFEGRTYTGYTSTYIEDNTVYGIKKGGNNWKRYVPPAPKGVTTSPDVESFIPFNFVVPALTGTSSTKWPVLNNGQLTEAVQMPGMLRMQLVPDQPAGLKLTGVTSDRVWMS